MWGQTKLEERMDAATHDHYVYLQGYYAGRQDTWALANWIYRNPTKPCPRKEPDSPYRRLLKHLERQWKKGRTLTC